jgi:hypothetical protein
VRFCFFARQAGFAVWGDPEARSGHYISYPVTPGDFVALDEVTTATNQQIDAMRSVWVQRLCALQAAAAEGV